MKKTVFTFVVGTLLFLFTACATEQKDYSRDQEKAREHGQEAFQSPEINE